LHTAILDSIEDAWCKLINEVGRIESITTREWAVIGQPAVHPRPGLWHIGGLFHEKKPAVGLGFVSSIRLIFRGDRLDLENRFCDVETDCCNAGP
jgi:hypothetical protein